MTTNKEIMMSLVKEWLLEDTEISQLEAQIREKKKKRKMVADEIMRIMNENEIDSVGIKGGEIRYQKKNVKKALSRGHLVNLLQQYYKNNLEEVNKLDEFLQNNREIKVEEKLVRKFTD